MNQNKMFQQLPLFASLSDEELQGLVETLRQREIPAGSLLFREGDPGDRFSIILEGEIEIVKALGTDGERVMAVRGRGEFLGEMSLLNPDGQRTASARSRTQAHLLEISQEDFPALLNRNPDLVLHLLRQQSLRLRDAENATIRDLQEKNRQLAEAYRELQLTQALRIENEKMEHELRMARQIQESILPRVLPRLPGFSFGACMVPARAVGGDFFDFIHLDRNRLGVVIGDVTDKGVPAAIFMAHSRSLLRAEARRSVSPAVTLHRVNAHLLDMNEAGMFVTVIYGILNRLNGEFTYARAGHEIPLLMDPEGSFLPLPTDLGQPLGIFGDPKLDQQTARIPSGGALMMYTDGVTEARHPSGEFFGVEGAQQALQPCLRSTAQQLCDHLLAEVLEYSGQGAQSDDITLTAIRRD